MSHAENEGTGGPKLRQQASNRAWLLSTADGAGSSPHGASEVIGQLAAFASAHPQGAASQSTLRSPHHPRPSKLLLGQSSHLYDNAG